MESSGSITPQATPYSEIDAGTVLKLGSGARLVFVDYFRCTQVTVTGGVLKFAAKGYEATGSAQKSEVRVPCQREIAASGVGEAATGVMRGAAVQQTRVSERPSFVVVGPHADDYASATISRDGKAVASGPIEGRKFEWPSATPALQPGAYQVALIPKQNGAISHQISVVVEGEKNSHPPSNQLVLLRVN